VSVPPCFYLSRKFSGKIQILSQKHMASAAAISQSVLENIRGFRVIRVFQSEQREVERFESVLENQRANAMQLEREILKGNTALSMLNLTGGCLVFAIVGSRLIEGAIPIGNFMGFIAALTSLQEPIARLLRFHNGVYKQAGQCQQLFDLHTQALGPRGRIGREFKNKVEKITFDNVSFSYENEAATPVLNGVTFEAKRGDVVAILGENGAGKTTLLNLVPRLYEPTGGSIKADGLNISEIMTDQWRDQITMLAQDLVLFDDTIFNNIAYGNKNASMSDIETASRLAFAHDFITAWPAGYQTKVGEAGNLISEGQKQKVALARALLKDAPVIILDEPASALDQSARAAIASAIRILSKDKIIFIVTHTTEFLPPHTKYIRLKKESSSRVEVPAKIVV
jgi:ABC-type multidrug transport system fused ATPase/permease subunit